jgi:MFS family permease
MSKIVSKDFVLAASAAFFFFFSIFVVLPYLPLYILHIGGNSVEVGWIIGIAAISAVLIRPITGFLVDRIGRLIWVSVGAILLTLSSVLYIYLDDVLYLFIIRFIIGIGVALFTVGASSYVADLAPDGKRSEIFGYYGASINTATAFGPLVATYIFHITNGNYTYIFYIATISSLIGAVIAQLLSARGFVPNKENKLTIIEKKVLIPSILAGAVLFNYAAIVTIVPLYLATKGIMDPGLFFAIYGFTLILIRPMGGMLSDRHGRWATIFPAIAIIMFLLIMINDKMLLLAIAFVYACGIGLIMPSLNAYCIDLVNPSERGAALATYTTIFDIGLSIGAVSLGYLAHLAGYNAVFILCAVVILLSGLLYFLRPNKVATENA